MTLFDNDILEVSRTPNVVYVIDGHGDGWYCSGVGTEPDDLYGECVHEDVVVYSRDFGG